MAWRLARLAPRRRRQAWLVSFVGLVMLVGAFLAVVVAKNSGSYVHGDEVVAILANEAGWRSRSQGRYVHRVRFADGTEGRLTLGAIYTPGDLVHVVYSRNLRWGYVTVFMHNHTSGTSSSYQAQQGR